MPLGRREAELALAILWRLRTELSGTDGDEEPVPGEDQDAVLSKPISILQCYLTDILPAIRPRGMAGEFPDSSLRVEVSSDAKIQLVEINCNTTKDPGLSLLGYTAAGGEQHYCVSHVETGTIFGRAGVFKRGDIVLSVNDRKFSRVTPEKAKYVSIFVIYSSHALIFFTLFSQVVATKRCQVKENVNKSNHM